MTTLNQTIIQYMFLPHLTLHVSLCVLTSYQSVVLSYQNEAVVVNEVAVNVLLNRKQSVKAAARSESDKIMDG